MKMNRQHGTSIGLMVLVLCSAAHLAAGWATESAASGLPRHLLASGPAEPTSLDECPGDLRGKQTGGCVQRLQVLLNAWGAKPALKVDGKFDSNTAAAVKSYQKAKGLGQTGVADSDVKTKLEADIIVPVASIIADCPKDIKIDEVSGCALLMQVLLNANGVQPKLTQDGWFGPKTLAGLKSFQKAKGLKVTGVADSKTKEALAAIIKEVASLTADCPKDIKIGEVSGCALLMQVLLNAAGADPKLTQDGWFGQKTEAGLKSFQKAKGLPVTGVADSKTKAKLESFVEPVSSLVKGCPKDIKIGDVNGCVRRMQKLINNAGVKPALAVDGWFGEKTLAGVKSFQKSKGLKADGVCDSKTKKALESK